MDFEKKFLSWEEFYKMINKIAKDIEKDNIKIDVLVPILKGGFIPSMFLDKHLNIDKHAFIHTRSSDSNLSNCDFHTPAFLGITNKKLIKNSNILIVDDVIATGNTLNLVLNKIQKLNPKNIYICSLYNYYDSQIKIYSGNNSKPKEKWIIFPWDYESEYK